MLYHDLACVNYNFHDRRRGESSKKECERGGEKCVDGTRAGLEIKEPKLMEYRLY